MEESKKERLKSGLQGAISEIFYVLLSNMLIKMILLTLSPTNSSQNLQAIIAL